jgi:hypothetical protein
MAALYCRSAMAELQRAHDAVAFTPHGDIGGHEAEHVEFRRQFSRVMHPAVHGLQRSAGIIFAEVPQQLLPQSGRVLGDVLDLQGRHLKAFKIRPARHSRLERDSQDLDGRRSETRDTGPV